MRIITIHVLREFWERYPDAKEPIKAWVNAVKEATWLTPQDVKASYGNASIIGNNRVVFNIRGNRYRLVVGMSYRRQGVYVKFFGTHAQYDDIDASTIELED